MTPSSATVTYAWALNGTVEATTATYTVPAKAKDGDEITLTVTDADGNKAAATVYVGGLTILKVEPLAQGDTYKFVKAYFSTALASLSPSEIEIRGKKDQKLYSIQTAVLSTDGMAADLTLYGSNADDGTTFLQPNTTYVMTLTQNGQSASLEFELPAYATDKIVTSVDPVKNTITTARSWKTGETGNAGTFTVAGKYDGNLGTLIGRTVNYQYDTDNNLTAFTLEDADVVYGAMKFVNDDDNYETAYFKDALTGETYKLCVDATASKNESRVFNAHNGAERWVTEGTTYNYTKLVLNPDGTVSTANIVQELAQNLIVASVDGTKVIQDKDNAFDLDGYIIVKDDEYVEPADLEVGDIVFINTGLKFADVFTYTISGELSNVVSGKLDIDEKTYNWNGAQYYDDDDEVYKTLSTNDTEAAQAYLNSLDTEEDTTIWIARNKNIKYIDGEVVGVKKYTYETYLITKTAAAYTESLKNKFNVDVFDGTNTETVTIDLSQLKFYKGVAGKYEADDAAKWGDTGDADYGDWTFAGKTNATYDGADYDVATLLPQGRLVKFMYDEAGALVGLSDGEDTEATAENSSLDGTNALGAANSPNLTDESAKLVQDTTATTSKVYTMGNYTNLWIWNEKNPKSATDATNGDDTYTKVTLTDFENEIETDNADPFKGITYRVDGTKITDLVVKIKNDNAYAKAETNTIAGVIDDITYKNDDTDTAQVVNTITIYGTDGKKVKYTANGEFGTITGGYKKGSYVELTQNKTTELITAAEMKADWSMATDAATDSLASAHATTYYHNNKLILSNNTTELTVASGGKILKRYQKEGSWKYDIVDYSDVNVIDGDVDVWYNNTYVSSDGSKVQSNMIVVQAISGDTVAPATATVTIAGDISRSAGSIVSTASTKLTPTVTDPDGTIEEIDSWKWYYIAAGSTVKEAALVTATQAPVTTKALVLATTDGGTVNGSKFFVVMTDSDGNTYTSNTITMEEPVVTTVSLAAGFASENLKTGEPSTAIATISDQFGKAIAVDATAMTPTYKAGTGTATATFAANTTGKVTITVTAGTTAVAEGDEFSLVLGNKKLKATCQTTATNMILTAE